MAWTETGWQKWSKSFRYMDIYPQEILFPALVFIFLFFFNIGSLYKKRCGAVQLQTEKVF